MIGSIAHRFASFGITNFPRPDFTAEVAVIERALEEIDLPQDRRSIAILVTHGMVLVAAVLDRRAAKHHRLAELCRPAIADARAEAIANAVDAANAMLDAIVTKQRG